MTTVSGNKLFHTFTILLVKKYFLCIYSLTVLVSGRKAIEITFGSWTDLISLLILLLFFFLFFLLKRRLQKPQGSAVSNRIAMKFARSSRKYASVDRQQDPGKEPRCLRHLVSAENFTDSVHQAHYKWHSHEHHGLLASLWKGQVVPVEVFSGTWLDQLQRRTTTVSSPPRCDHHLIGWDLLVDQDPPGWGDEDVRPQNFGVHTAWRKAKERDTWHQVVSTATLC